MSSQWSRSVCGIGGRGQTESLAHVFITTFNKKILIHAMLNRPAAVWGFVFIFLLWHPSKSSNSTSCSSINYYFCSPSVAVFLHAVRPDDSKPHCELHTSLPYCYIDFQVIECAGLVLTLCLIFVPCWCSALETVPLAWKSRLSQDICLLTHLALCLWPGSFKWIYRHFYITSLFKTQFIFCFLLNSRTTPMDLVSHITMASYVVFQPRIHF